ncbi:MAG: hypothetical protein PHD13_01405 [Methanocellales archaeon]|nr:hypothetical protein [Methanocellales archaeon]MDD3290935.1 hypothetical protein [Methanocellales archaeon]MDD3292321.1 hypothetical protein [Methanocellales archaeon]MDD5234820.1 hypothetical protein [Methanocellales archaeon]MDD5484810.1 hypothetical protein [Methanocellales archaeon]
MRHINAWFNKMDQLFLLSPSFYIILSGALIGASINLLTGLIFTKEVSSIYVKLVITFLLGSSGLLAYIGLILEDLRSKVGEDTDSLRRMVLHRRIKLYPIAIMGFTFLLVSVCLLINILGFID